MSTPLVRGAGGSRTGARGEDTRRLALRSAEDVFATLGYAGARMEDVAERVGIRRASLMYYFRDKHALYEALLGISMWEMAGATPAEEVPLAARVRPICERLAEAVREGQRQGVFRADVD